MPEYGSGGGYTVVMAGPFASSGGGTGKLTTISAPVANWKGGTSPYSQVIAIDDISVNSKIDIQFSADQIELFRGMDIAFTVENRGGEVTLVAVGDKPSADCVFQATASEVLIVGNIDSTVILGNTVKTTSFPKTGGSMSNPINMNSQNLTGLKNPKAPDHAANMGFVNEQVKEAAPKNLMDNSWFRKFVAQAGVNGMHGNTKFPMDRWISWDKDITVGDGYIIPGSPIDQRVSLDVVDVNKKYTVAVCLDDGTIVLRAGLFTETFGSTSLPFYCYAPDGSDYVVVRLGAGNRIRWVALYEGEYTSETLPKHHPKRFGEELAECQRYYLPLKNETICAGYIASDGKQIWLHIPAPSTMRVTPTFAYSGKIGLRSIQTAWNLENWTVSAVYNRENGVVIGISQNETTFPAGTVCSAYFAGTASLVADI